MKLLLSRILLWSFLNHPRPRKFVGIIYQKVKFLELSSPFKITESLMLQANASGSLGCVSAVHSSHAARARGLYYSNDYLK